MLLINGNKIEFENVFKILNKHILKACIFSYRVYILSVIPVGVLFFAFLLDNYFSICYTIFSVLLVYKI